MLLFLRNFCGVDQWCHGDREESCCRSSDGLIGSMTRRRKNPMTQLLLFDAPVSNSAATAIPPAVHSDVEPPLIVSDPQSRVKRPSCGPMDDVQPGLNRMGDLARLVLLRYDMVAQRRAELAQKRREASAEKRSIAR
jgi:hypothetical protein